MMIPDDLKIFSLIYEYRMWLLAPSAAAWLTGCFFFLFRLKKVFFLWLLIFPLFIQPLNIAATWCGWHYRMELRNLFARADSGWSDEHGPHPVNIDLMPAEIRAEYARHNYRPRFRDIKAMTVGMILLIPALYVMGGLSFAAISLTRSFRSGRKKIEKKD